MQSSAGEGVGIIHYCSINLSEWMHMLILLIGELKNIRIRNIGMSSSPRCRHQHVLVILDQMNLFSWYLWDLLVDTQIAGCAVALRASSQSPADLCCPHEVYTGLWIGVRLRGGCLIKSLSQAMYVGGS